MKVVWRLKEATAQEIKRELEKSVTWSEATVKTLLNRLVKKGVLGFAQHGRSYSYYPLVREEDCCAAESATFLERVFDGGLAPMLAHFVERTKLSPAEVKELEKILKQRKRP